MSMKSIGLVSWMVDLTQLVSVNLLTVSRSRRPRCTPSGLLRKP